jgi:hypothetical protein
MTGLSDPICMIGLKAASAPIIPVSVYAGPHSISSAGDDIIRFVHTMNVVDQFPVSS